MAVDRHEIENFLYREARFMDEHRYDEWEALWTDDALYWVPCGGNNIDPKRQVSVIYANREDITARVERMKTEMNWAQDPKSGLSRVVSNIEIEEGENGEVTVYSTFNLTEHRRRAQNTWMHTWAGRTIHKLRHENGSYKMSFKKVMLVNNDAEIPTLWFLI
ncbi:MAG TPA: aromatic-ring-hydroxylating dioxygenase subunit beta [Dehalococcoidia bacterium]|nr:aromatic-ring-hydroxylating dioxygenase subunit beta [Dehalococcoidia bacterium]